MNTCANCRFYTSDNGGECHERSPFVFLIQGIKQQKVAKMIGPNRAQVGVEMDYQTFTAWPSIPSDKWCGCHKPKEN